MLYNAAPTEIIIKQWNKIANKDLCFKILPDKNLGNLKYDKIYMNNGDIDLLTIGE